VIPSARWDIPRPVWTILLSWGAAVLMISALLSAWIWMNQRAAEAERDKAQREQDRAMCVMLDLFTSGPPPPAGAVGERGRAVVAAMTAYRATLQCDSLPPVDQPR
jgi:hypothetical protein